MVEGQCFKMQVCYLSGMMQPTNQETTGVGKTVSKSEGALQALRSVRRLRERREP